MEKIINQELKNKTGFSLVEGIVAVGVFLIIMTSLFSLFHNIYGAIRNNKARIVANGIAMEQLEVIRGMDYDNVRTSTGWVPVGPIPSDRTLDRSGVHFTVQVDIGRVDDPYDYKDDTPAPNTDLFSLDYKKARVRVSWTSLVSGGTETVAMSTNVVPPGIEGLTSGKGGILITVFNASGQPVPNAVVDITNSAKGWSSLGNLTDLNGNLFVLNIYPSDAAPAGNYRIVVSKAGYNSDQTYAVDNNASSPTYNPTPSKPDSIVSAGVLTQVGFSIDLVSDIIIKTTSYENPDNKLINTNIGSTSQSEVALDIDSSDNIILVWLDDRRGGGNVDRIYAQKYKYNVGTSQFDKLWTNDAELTTSNNKEKPRVAVSGTNFYVSWNNESSGNENVQLQKFNSLNDPPTSLFGPVDANIGGGSDDQIKSDLAADADDNLYIVWQDSRNTGKGWDIYIRKFNSSLIGQWADIKVHSYDGVADQINPRLAISAVGDIYVVWEDERNGNKDIYWKKFDSSGNPVFDDTQINTDTSSLDQYEPSIVYGNGNIYIAWADKRDSQPDIYAQKFNTDGTPQWPGGEVKINDDSLSDAWRTKPAVAYASNGNVLYFSWEDTRNGNPDVYSTKINPADGARLWTYDLIMNGSAANVQGAPDVVADSEGYGITTWQDERSGDFDIYAARYKELGALVGKSVNIVITGTKLRGTYPNGLPPPDDLNLPIYKGLPLSDPQYVNNPNCWGTNVLGCTITTSNNDVDRGEYRLTGIEWDNYSFDTDEDHYIVSTDQPVPLEVGPNETIGNGLKKTIVINVEP